METVEELLKKIKAYQIILRLVQNETNLPDILIEHPEIVLAAEPTSDDIDWAKKVIAEYESFRQE